MKIESNALSKEALSHRTYVEGVMRYYRDNDIQIGDPNEGTWNLAHYPCPKRLGGTRVIHLLEEHHAVQGVLQSEEFGKPCVYGWERKYLSGEIRDLLEKWMSVQRSEAVTNGWKNADEQRRKERRSNIAKGTADEYASRTEKEKERHRDIRILADPKRKRVEIVFENGSVKVYPSMRQTVKDLRMSMKTLRRICNGETVEGWSISARYI